MDGGRKMMGTGAFITYSHLVCETQNHGMARSVQPTEI
jgi:hypothetical protein